MLILLSNDDGYLAPGLQALASALRSYADRVLIMAPDRNMSGASHSLTLSRPLSVQTHGNDVFSVDGTPSDCVHLALNGYFEHKVDMVVSGINRGANLGDDVMYSGTVAAAYEGRNLGFPAVAVSNVSHCPQHFADSALLVVDLLKRLQKHTLPQGTFLNVNIPRVRGLKRLFWGDVCRRSPYNALTVRAATNIYGSALSAWQTMRRRIRILPQWRKAMYRLRPCNLI